MQPYISGLFIYPVKSLGGISLQTSTVLRKGLRWDRRWMLIDEENTFITQRVFHQMAFFKMRLEGEIFTINYHGDEIILPHTHASDPIVAKVWDDTVEVFEVDPALSQWMSKRMNRTVRLVAFPEGNTRPLEAPFHLEGNDVSLADAFPLLIIGQASLDDLNSRLEQPVPMNRFRPNMVVSGATAFAEDNWSNFRIGNVKLQAVKPCARCVLVTVDQQTAIKGKEPLATLAKYRTINKKVMFGQDVLPHSYGDISVGDKIDIIDFRNQL